MTILYKQYTTVQSRTYLCPILNISIFAVSSTSGSTLAPDAGTAGPVDNNRSQLGNMPDSNNNTSLLDMHDQEMQEIQ